MSMATTVDEDQNDFRRVQVKIAKTFMLLVGVYILCWTPMTINLIIQAASNDPMILKNSALYIFYSLSIWAAHFNSAIDPIIYAYKIKDIRNSIKQVLLPCRRVEQNSPSSAI